MLKLTSVSAVKRMGLGIFFFTFMMSLSHENRAQNRYFIEEGKVVFASDAPLELIEASTSSILGILDKEKKAFAVSIPISTFRGFNAPLQREHFNENYMETEKYPKGIYKGLILDEIDFNKNGYYTVLTEGKLLLHGIEQTRRIKCDIVVEDDVVRLASSFQVELEEHNIKIPTIVSRKLSEVINVNIEADFVLKK